MSSRPARTPSGGWRYSVASPVTSPTTSPAAPPGPSLLPEHATLLHRLRGQVIQLCDQIQTVAPRIPANGLLHDELVALDLPAIAVELRSFHDAVGALNADESAI